ncbi:transposase [Streptomyces exfoliatus]|uniref:transposase n=1 Tax=Streptomyces exfoliatus TaxID=1905 RepID=UPI003C2C6AE7
MAVAPTAPQPSGLDHESQSIREGPAQRRGEWAPRVTEHACPLASGAFHRVRTGVQWRDLPERFGPWKTVYEPPPSRRCRRPVTGDRRPAIGDRRSATGGFGADGAQIGSGGASRARLTGGGARLR